MTAWSPKGATSWLRDVLENSAAVVEVMAPELERGLRLAKAALWSRAEGLARQARGTATGSKR